MEELLAAEIEAVSNEMVPEAELDLRSLAGPPCAQDVSDLPAGTELLKNLGPARKKQRTGEGEEEDEEDWIQTLGKLAEITSCRYRDVGLSDLIGEVRGQSDITDGVESVPHAAAAYLETLRSKGAAVELKDQPWSPAKLEEAAEYGSHKSCDRDLSFVAKEMLSFADKGFFLVLKYEDAKSMPNLRLAPMGLVPQRERRDRIVVDYSYWGTNDVSLPTAPQEAMQFGRALQRVLQRMYDADPKHGPVHLMKLDVADGFYRVWLRAEDAPSLGVMLPTMPGQPKLVAIPTVLPMGWTQSPPYFCSLTETVADLANDTLRQRPEQISEHHRLEDQADTAPAPLPETSPTLPMDHNRQGYHQRPLAYIDVFVDDFLGLAQGDRRRRARVRRALLQSFDLVFRPLEAGEGARSEPVSVKKLLKGDAAWATSKVLLGWLVDSIRGTIELPSHRWERLQTLIADYRNRRRASLKEWQKLLGELRSMTVALPGSAGLFTHMQAALVRAGSGHRVRLTKPVHDELDDWAWIVGTLGNRPTSIAEVVKKHPSYGGDCDAAKAGMGGVCFNLRHPEAAPVLWRAPFPSDIQARVVSFDNPTGDITNSDLELAGVIAQNDVMSQLWDVRHTTIGTRTDNSPAVGWTLRGSISRDGPVAYLLRLFALHRRAYRYTCAIEHLPGVQNRMADDCSRLWYLTNPQLLQYFNTHYPQARPWRMYRLRQEMHSSLISALRSKRSSPASWLNVPKPTRKSGEKSGDLSARSSAKTSSSPTSRTQYRYCKSSSDEFGTDASPYINMQYADVLQKRISGRSARRSPGWGGPIPG